MTKNEFERRARLTTALTGLGFTEYEVDVLRRISNTLRRGHELECGTDSGAVERDETTGKPIFRSTSGRSWPVADRETGAIKRLQAIMHRRNDFFVPGLPEKHRLWECDDGTLDILDFDGEIAIYNVPKNKAPLAYYIQTDPRGAALYILRPGDVPPGEDPAAYYSKGICVY